MDTILLNNQNENVSSLQEDLMNFLDAEEQNDLNISENSDEVISAEQANYYIKKVKEMQTEIKDIQDTAKAEKEKQSSRIDEWVKSKTSSLSFNIERYSSMLRDFWVKNGNNKTMKLSHGSLCMRKMPTTTEFKEEELFNLLDEYGITYAFSKTELNKSILRKNLVNNNDGTFKIALDNNLYDITNCVSVKTQEPKFEVK